MLPNESLRERNERLFDCEAPVIFVTGSAAPRVGRRVIETFLSQQFRVVLHAHQDTSQTRAAVENLPVASDRILLLTGAVESEANVQSWVAQTLDHFGRIDVQVNSAAIWDPRPLEHCTADDYERNFRINTLGTALCGQHFGLAMTRQSSGGVIINIGDWAVTRPYGNFAPYLISKGAVEVWTQTLAVELAQRNPRLRVNAVLPGPIQLAESVSAERQQKIIQASLLQRAGSADDLAQAVLFLATSPFITGVCLPVDGGRSIWAGAGLDHIAHPDC